MKKLMIVAALMVVGMTASAYQYRWRVSGTAVMDGAGDQAAGVAEGTMAYIFNARDYSQSQLLTDFFVNSVAESTILGNSFLAGLGANSNGEYKSYTSKVSSTPDDNIVGTTYNPGTAETADVYFAIIKDGKVFVSETNSQTLDWSGPTATTSFTFDPDVHYDNSGNTVTFDTTTGFGGNAWYQAGAVPEPTSGLLLLLGVAGLALRRRRV